MKLLSYLCLKDKRRYGSWNLEIGVVQRRSWTCQNQPTAMWTRRSWWEGEDINLTLQLSLVPLIGQSQLEVKEEGNSYATPASWAPKSQSECGRHREGQMENMSPGEESGWFQGLWPKHLERQSCHLLDGKDFRCSAFGKENQRFCFDMLNWSVWVELCIRKLYI